MSVGLIGRKIGMTQIFDEEGIVIPVTVVEAGPCYVLDNKDQEKHGYNSVLLGFQDKKSKKVNKPEKGFYDKLNAEAHETVLPKKILKEFRLEEQSNFIIGDIIKVDIFAEGDMVDIQGKSKGKGFAGAIKRHNYKRGPMGHGSSHHRCPGSMGGCADPGKVFKGKKLPGRYGGKPNTVQNLKVEAVNPEENIILIKGAIPGATNNIVYISEAIKKKNKNVKYSAQTKKTEKSKKISNNIEKKLNNIFDNKSKNKSELVIETLKIISQEKKNIEIINLYCKKLIDLNIYLLMVSEKEDKNYVYVINGIKNKLNDGQYVENKLLNIFNVYSILIYQVLEEIKNTIIDNITNKDFGIYKKKLKSAYEILKFYPMPSFYTDILNRIHIAKEFKDEFLRLMYKEYINNNLNDNGMNYNILDKAKGENNEDIEERALALQTLVYLDETDEKLSEEIYKLYKDILLSKSEDNKNIKLKTIASTYIKYLTVIESDKELITQKIIEFVSKNSSENLETIYVGAFNTISSIGTLNQNILDFIKHSITYNNETITSNALICIMEMLGNNSIRENILKNKIYLLLDHLISQNLILYLKNLDVLRNGFIVSISLEILYKLDEKLFSFQKKYIYENFDLSRDVNHFIDDRIKYIIKYSKATGKKNDN